ncbi:MAG TPA: diaminopimelate decarboxylase [Acidimicrobiia bacterium]|jgi:diaminopimelate decarboxylase|nr:diaminopimelate decarboxylase [Acidimicrobiia bacterium]HIL46211.1 diaminopimelate decarboxylase [Acidimicrobiia bacterium]
MAGPIQQRLLPDTAAIDTDGQATVGGCRLTDLADQFGTPLFVYDEEHLRARCREAVAAFGPGVSYASKAFLCGAMARLVVEEGMHVDVSTGGELYMACHAGVPGEKLIMHGNNKSELELRMAIDEGVRRIVVDSFDELDRLEALHAETGSTPKILLRITPGVEAHTHEFISTGQDDSKFGFTVSTGLAAVAVERAVVSPAVELMGVHCHIGSQVFEVGSFARTVEIMAQFSAPLGLPDLSIGGGLGVAYLEEDQASTITQWGEVVQAGCAAAGVTAQVTAEPGRAIAAAAAITLYRVGTIKELPGLRTYVAVDGGMSDNPRPVLYGSGYETFLPRVVGQERSQSVRVVGKHCESGDLLVREGWVPDDLAVGDVLATPVTGAYGHSMGSNYNQVLRPAVVFVKDGQATEVVARETFADLVRRER